MTDEWVKWVEAMGPQVQLHAGALYPLSRGQWLRLMSGVQEYMEAYCGERPRLVVALQQNRRGGLHGHALGCGSDRLQQVRRTDLWAHVRQMAAGMIGEGQPHKVVYDWPVYRTHEFSAGAMVALRTAIQGELNEVRARILPVHRGPDGTRQLVSYITRYVLREDVESLLEVLT